MTIKREKLDQGPIGPRGAWINLLTRTANQLNEVIAIGININHAADALGDLRQAHDVLAKVAAKMADDFEREMGPK
jgi:hypothetical protein